MFLGHFAMAFAAKAAAPKTSLGTTLLAAQAADLLWPTLLLLGVERARIQEGITKVIPLDLEYYPFSHSLLAAVLLGALIGGVHLLFGSSRVGFGSGESFLRKPVACACALGRNNRRDVRGAVVLGLAVLSHWVLDAVSHRPDMPLAPGIDLRVGLGLWNSVEGTVVTELVLFAAGVGLYLWRTTARDGIGRWALWALLAILGGLFAGNIAGVPPPNMDAVAWAGQALWLFVAWAWWIDRHRDVTR
jgi:hypothetical protein